MVHTSGNKVDPRKKIEYILADINSFESEDKYDLRRLHAVVRIFTRVCALFPFVGAHCSGRVDFSDRF